MICTPLTPTFRSAAVAASGDLSTGTGDRIPPARSVAAAQPDLEEPPGTHVGHSAIPVRRRVDWRRDIGVPLAIFVATRLGQLVFLAWLRPPGGASIRTRLLSWDSGWFLNVAQNGYPHGFSYSGSTVTGNGLAFFPVYPTLIRAGHRLGLGYGTSALTISWLAAAVAAVLLAALGRELAAAGRFGIVDHPRRVGYALVVLVCAQPMSVTLSMGYTEALFVALVAGALLAAHRHTWLTAGVLGVAAGLTRPTGAALAVALGFAALARVLDRNASVRERMTAGAAGAVALASVPAYILWVGARVGHWNAWFTIQTAGWGTTFDYGRSSWDFVSTTLRGGDGWIAMSVVFILIAAVIAMLVAVVRPGWWPLTIYGIISFVLVVGQAGFYHSKPRLLVPVLLLFVPAALAAGRTRPRNAALWLLAYAAFGLWYGAYMITVWRYAI